MASRPSIDDTTISGGKRCGIETSDWLDGWWAAWSPRNANMTAEGPWCHWVHLARKILAHPRTKAEMPDHFVPYDAPHVYDEHHPDCLAPDQS